jgi:NNP family nitrate/nitrite transporter-like MFS transporter
VLGILGDRIGGRRAALIGMVLTLMALVVGWRLATTVPRLYGVGLLLGIAGASFAVALPLASRWYPPEYQGLAMGIAGAGNSGTLLATLFAPRLAERFGWAATMGLATIPVAVVFVFFACIAKDSPKPRPQTSLRDYGRMLRESDTVWLSFLDSLTFGGFVGLASFLTTFFHEQYHLTRVAAGDFTTVVVVAGSLLRPVGGWLSDRFGGYRLLVGLLAGAGLCLAMVASMPPAGVAVTVLGVGMGLLGMGNGAVFQLVPQRFPDKIGIVTGVVGAAGGLGGFVLPTLLGTVKDVTGLYSLGFAGVAVVFVLATVVLLELGARWSTQWAPDALERTGVYSYRASLRPAADESAA